MRIGLLSRADEAEHAACNFNPFAERVTLGAPVRHRETRDPRVGDGTENALLTSSLADAAHELCRCLSSVMGRASIERTFAIAKPAREEVRCGLWSPVVASGSNRRQIEEPRKPQKQAKTVATGCHLLPEKFHGKEERCARSQELQLAGASHRPPL